MVVQGDQQHFTFHTGLPEGTDFAPVIQERIGATVDIEVSAVKSWKLHLLVADRYRDRAGAAGRRRRTLGDPTRRSRNEHRHRRRDRPRVETGRNLEGWGGPGLLDSYENDRRQVGQRNIRASEYAALGTAEWRKASTDKVAERLREGARIRSQVAELADGTPEKGPRDGRIELGYRYLDSPLVGYSTAEETEDGYSYAYHPRSDPVTGSRTRGAADGSALHDHLGLATTYAARRHCRGHQELEQAIRATGAPVKVHQFPEPHLRKVYGADLILLQAGSARRLAWRHGAGRCHRARRTRHRPSAPSGPPGWPGRPPRGRRRISGTSRRTAWRASSCRGLTDAMPRNPNGNVQKQKRGQRVIRLAEW